MLLLATLSVEAKVTLPKLFSDDMILQRGKPIPVWGWADKGEKINILFNKKEYTVTADEQGNWRIDLPKMKAGGPYTLQISDIKISNVLIGDVWLCSGQSNMDLEVSRVAPQYPGETEKYTNKNIRLYRVMNTTNTHAPAKDVNSTGWHEVTPQSARNFSALGYFLAQKLYERTHVPQGVICNSWGGTPVESWLSADSLKKDFPLYYNRTKLYQDDEYVASQQRANMRINNQWTKVLNETDPGTSEFDFTSAGYDDSAWNTVNQYHPGRLNNCGSTWFRQHIIIDDAHAGKSALLLLGTLFDADYTYINGKEVGRTYYQYPPRRYHIPAGLLKKGDNVISVRFVNKMGSPRFTENKPYQIVFADNDIMPLSEQWKTHVGAQMPNCPSTALDIQYLPYVLYNAMLYPLHPYGIAGAVWYQGESNTGRANEYAPLLKKMMGNWRTLWNNNELPFVIVQLANFMSPSEQPTPRSGWAQLREAQRVVARDDKNAGLAVAIDLGEANDIHPLRKKEVAARVAQHFLKMVYKDKKTQLSPEIVAVKQSDNKIIITFNQPLREGMLHEFELCDAAGHFTNVEAIAQGNTVIISNGVGKVTAIHYAWKDNPAKADCYGANGEPVSPFEYKL